MLYQFVFIIILLFCSAFFSGVEVALFSISNLRIKRFEKETKEGKILAELRRNPKRLITTILLGNELINILATSVMTSFLIYFFKSKALILSTIIMLILILIFGEMTPKLLALEIPEKFALSSAKPFYFFYKLTAIPTKILSLIPSFILSILKMKETQNKITEDEFKKLIDEGRKEGVIDNMEKLMIEQALEFPEKKVEDIMIPKSKMFCFEIHESPKVILKKLRKRFYSRIPVYLGAKTKIKGIVFVKDILLKIKRCGFNWKLSEILQPVFFVSPKLKIYKLLKEFQKRKVHLAIVADSKGQVLGLVSLEDVLEELFGEIYDEFDQRR